MVILELSNFNPSPTMATGPTGQPPSLVGKNRCVASPPKALPQKGNHLKSTKKQMYFGFILIKVSAVLTMVDVRMYETFR